MEEAEQILPILQEHPVINEIALRMSYYAYRMDDYEKCKKYYEEYRRTKHLVSIEQYAPGLHTYYMVVSFAMQSRQFRQQVSSREKMHPSERASRILCPDQQKKNMLF